VRAAADGDVGGCGGRTTVAAEEGRVKVVDVFSKLVDMSALGYCSVVVWPASIPPRDGGNAAYNGPAAKVPDAPFLRSL